jgi:hypothetical protein
MSPALHKLTFASRNTLRRPISQLPRQFTTSSSLASRLRQPGEPTGPNEPPTHTTSPPSKSPLKVWPILAIFGIGTYLFTAIVDQRKDQNKAQGPAVGHSPSRP